MTYVLEELLDIRSQREDAALNTLQRDKRELEAARIESEAMAGKLRAYTEWRKSEEQRLFRELTRRQRKISDIEQYNQIVDDLREKEESLAEQLTQAQHKVSQTEADLDESKKQYARYCREKRKLEEHKKIWAKENRLKFERLTENELDELNRINMSGPN